MIGLRRDIFVQYEQDRAPNHDFENAISSSSSWYEIVACYGSEL